MSIFLYDSFYARASAIILGFELEPKLELDFDHWPFHQIELFVHCNCAMLHKHTNTQTHIHPMRMAKIVHNVDQYICVRSYFGQQAICINLELCVYRSRMAEFSEKPNFEH